MRLLVLCVTPQNIISGFRKTGIHPFNPNIFKGEDFLPVYVTDDLEMEPEIAQTHKTCISVDAH